MAAPIASLTAFLVLLKRRSRLLAVASSFGLVGLFLVSIVDSSFVPLPIPGVTDIMVILFAAQHANLVVLILVATIGSALGGLFSQMIGQAGGMAFVAKRVPERFLTPVTRWMDSHALLAVALPAILPPPMPLSPFVLAAGALHMSRKKFLTAFTASRLLRHIIAAWIGVRYGQHFLQWWTRVSARWGEPVLIAIWVMILLTVGFAFWKLYRTSKTVELPPLRRKRSPAAPVPAGPTQ